MNIEHIQQQRIEKKNKRGKYSQSYTPVLMLLNSKMDLNMK